MRKGQITVFIIIGLVLVIMVALFLTLRTPTAIAPQQLDLGAAQTILRTCAQQATREAVMLAAAQGGVVYPDSNAFTVRDLSVEPGVIGTDNVLPSKAVTTAQMTAYIEAEVLRCVNNSPGFIGSIVSEDLPNVTVDIQPTVVLTTVDWQATVSRGNVTRSLSTERVSYQSEFGALQDEARGLAQHIATSPTIDVTAIAEKQFLHTLDPIDGTHILVVSTGPALTFNFLVERERKAAPTAPDLPRTLTLKRAEKRDFPLPVAAGVSYTEDSPIASISGTTLSVASDIAGSYSIIVTADNGLQTRTVMSVEVVQ